MRHLSLLAPLLLLLVTPSFTASADESATGSYLCIADMTTGFSFNQQHGTWRATTFQAESKYIITRASDNSGKWEVKATGKSKPDAFCEAGFNEFGLIWCKGNIDFNMNKYSLRFLAAHLLGFWTDNVPSLYEASKEGKITPYMEIGKCSPF